MLRRLTVEETFDSAGIEDDFQPLPILRASGKQNHSSADSRGYLSGFLNKSF